MAEIIDQYGAVTIYREPGHPTPFYEFGDDIPPNEYGALSALLEDDSLEEVMYNGGTQCVKIAHRKHGMCRTNIWIEDDEGMQISKNIASFTAVPLGDGPGMVPIFDGRLPDGSRVNGTIPPVSPDGPTLTIRKFKEDPITMVDLIKWGTVSPRLAAMFWCWVDGLGAKPANFVIAGGTGSGKTTTLNCLGMFVPWSDRVLSVEDTAELQIYHDHWLRMETRAERPGGTTEIGMDNCLKSSLRMRPDRVIVGEVRGPEAGTLLMAMNTGHDGSFGSLHANTASETVKRLVNPPMSVPSIMLSALDLIIMQARLNVGGKNIRRITEVAEIAGMEGDTPRLNPIWRFDASEGKIVETGVPSKLREIICEAKGCRPADFEAYVRQREQILTDLARRDVREIEQVTKVIQGYFATME